MHQKISSVTFYLEETLLKNSSSSYAYKYSNIELKGPLNIICIHDISGVQIYSDISLVNMWDPNIFGYSIWSYCGIPIYSDICVHFLIFAHHWCAVGSVRYPVSTADNLNVTSIAITCSVNFSSFWTNILDVGIFKSTF